MSIQFLHSFKRKTMHHKLEVAMGVFGRYLTRYPLKIIGMVVLLLALPIYYVPQIKMDTSTEGFMHPNDPVLVAYNTFRSQFGRDERIVVAIKSDTIFSLPFLETLRSLHEEIEQKVPYLNDVSSLYNVRHTRGEGDQLLTDDLLAPFPTTQAEVDKIKRQAMASHFYRDLLLSEDGKMTTIILETDAYSHEGEADVALEDAFEEETPSSLETQRPFLTDAENHELLARLEDVIKKYQSKGLEIYVAGSPAVNNALKAQMEQDMERFIWWTFAIIVLFLFLMFRRIVAVFYPLLVIVLALLTTIGAMAWMGVAFKLPTQIVPSLLLAVGIGATVHILSIFFDRFNQTSKKKEAIVYTLQHSGLAIAMTSVTTAIGVGSFSGSEVAPVSDLGIFASLGVMVSLFLTLTLLPALLAITPLQAHPKNGAGRLDILMKKLSILPIRYYKSIIVGSLILVLFSLFLSSKIELSHNPLFWFQPNDTNRVSTIAIDKEMHGSVTIEVVIDTHKESGWNNPEALQKLDKLARKLETYVDSYTRIGKVISLATIVKETNRALHENREAFYTIPTDVNLVSQELLLFENSGSDDLEDVVDTQFSKTRMTLKLPWTDAVKAKEVLAYVKKEVSQTFPNYEVRVTGMIPLLINTFAGSVHSSVTSYTIAFIAISFMMMLILGSVRLGLLSMIPNLTPIVLGMLLMYLFKIPLDMFTLLIGSIAIGLAVDDTIHFMHNFRRYYLQSGDAKQAIEETFFTTGKAMVITTIVLSLGFYAYMLAQMVAVKNFGFLTGCVIVLALLADLLLAPALMMVAAKRGWIK